jgi:hypothetical protein
LKAILLEELGVSPSNETNDAFASILAMDTKSQIHHKLLSPKSFDAGTTARQAA